MSVVGPLIDKWGPSVRVINAIVSRVDGRRPPMKGDTLYFAPKTDHIHLFDVETGERIND